MQRAAGHGAIPAGWHRVRLRELLALEQPGAWGEDPTPEERGVKVLRAADLTRDGRVNPSNAAWRRLSNRDMERRLMCDGDLILERSGGGPGNPVGRVALIENLGAVYCNNFCQQLRVDELACTSKYMARALWHRYTQGVTARLEHQTTGIRNLDYAAYLDLPILLPPLPEQRVIAAVLDSIDGAIEGAEAVIAATGQLRDSLLHDLLTRGLPGQHTEFRDVPGLGTIPADWDVVRLGDVCESPQYGASAPGQPYDPELPRYVRITDLTEDGRLKLEDARSAEPLRVLGYELEPGDLLFARSGATVGKTYMYRSKDGPCVYAGYLIKFRPKSSVLPDYLEYCTRSQFYDQWVMSMLRAGAQPNINAAEYSSLTIPLPSLAEQRAIAAAMDGVGAAIEVVREELAGLRLLKDSAADALLTGRVRM